MDAQLLKELYLGQNLSQQDVADRLGCSQTNVRYYLSKYEIRKLKSHTYIDEGKIETKTCPQCSQVQSLNSFYKRKSGTPGSWCKTCLNKATVSRQVQTKQACVLYKGGSCRICNFSEYYGALDFHHLDPTEKDFDISKRAFAKGTISERVKQELDKCILVCSNCHRMIHAGLVDLGCLGLEPRT